MMTEAEAIALAEKRERHKSKHMRHKRWAAVHDSVKGWHAALVDVYSSKPLNEPPAPGLSLGDMALILLMARLRAGCCPRCGLTRHFGECEPLVR